MSRRRRPRSRGRRAWFKPFSQKKYQQPNAYGIGVLYGKKHIPLDEELRSAWVKDYLIGRPQPELEGVFRELFGMYYSGQDTAFTLLTILEQREQWKLQLAKFERMIPVLLQNGKYEKIKLYSNQERYIFARERYSLEDQSPVSLVKSTTYHSRDDALLAWQNGRILWVKCLYPSSDSTA